MPLQSLYNGNIAGWMWWSYDPTGNLTQDLSENIPNKGISWTPYNKIDRIVKKNSGGTPLMKLAYLYDASGNRVVKDHYATSSDTINWTARTFYVRDAQGNTLGIFKRASGETYPNRQETSLYGSSRLGVSYKGSLHKTGADDTLAHYNEVYSRDLRQRGYELTDHLGNVRATVSDMLLPRTGNDFDADLRTLTDYYPFGMTMPGRSYEAAGLDAHRYGYNGKENDNEVKGEGNSLDYGARIYDPRVGRWLSVDPSGFKYPATSPYMSTEGNPIMLVDPDGREVAAYFDKKAGKLFIKNLDHYKEGLPTVLVNAKDYKYGGVRDEKGNLIQNQVLVIENVFSGGRFDPASGDVTRDLERDPRQLPIPNGMYDLLVLEKANNQYKLDPIDGSRFDDTHQGYLNSRGEERTGYRLHLGTISHGCVTVCDPLRTRDGEWDVLMTIFKSTSKTNVPKREGMQSLLPGSRERIGTLVVSGVDNHESQDSSQEDGE